MEEDFSKQRAKISRLVAAETIEAGDTGENDKLDEDTDDEKEQIAKRYDNDYNKKDIDLFDVTESHIVDVHEAKIRRL